MKATEFHISIAEDATRFDDAQAAYRISVGLAPWQHFSIRQAFEAFDGNEGKKMFAALMDLQLQCTILQRDLEVIRIELSTDYGDANQNSRDILANHALFARRMHLYHAASNCVLRTRAIWDKVMGVLILLLSPSEYEPWLKKEKRKKAFCELTKNWAEYGERMTERIQRIVSALDGEFRTAEAHGMGRLRKWAFATQIGEDDPFEELQQHSIELIEELSTISFVIKTAKARRN